MKIVTVNFVQTKIVTEINNTLLNNLFWPGKNVCIKIGFSNLSASEVGCVEKHAIIYCCSFSCYCCRLVQFKLLLAAILPPWTGVKESLISDDAGLGGWQWQLTIDYYINNNQIMQYKRQKTNGWNRGKMKQTETKWKEKIDLKMYHRTLHTLLKPAMIYLLIYHNKIQI